MEPRRYISLATWARDRQELAVLEGLNVIETPAITELTPESVVNIDIVMEDGADTLADAA